MRLKHRMSLMRGVKKNALKRKLKEKKKKIKIINK
jgi:hypothetical protein